MALLTVLQSLVFAHGWAYLLSRPVMFTCLYKKILVDNGFDNAKRALSSTPGKRASPRNPISWNWFCRHTYVIMFLKALNKLCDGYLGNFIYCFFLVNCKGLNIEGTLIHPTQLQGSNLRLIRRNWFIHGVMCQFSTNLGIAVNVFCT